ncbi:nicotinate-nucleotide--dimethylbenzimidazole phosphoribosyltransferase, partial [Thermus scotoductus]|uniref:nicotinate-nucleotide--dimethylbenzimidazole phosphoribosyltransferase n=1 Tax=Thermus scotoductus TaxID=37636 RepID=UPI001562AE53
PIRGLPEGVLARRRLRFMGLVFQHHFLFPELTALENVLAPAYLAGRVDRALALGLLARLGLGERADFLPPRPPGGARQREAVARALSRLRPGEHPLEVAAEVGGLELVAIAGVYLEGYRQGLPLVLDGFPVSAGALLAYRLEPGLKEYLFAGHLSREPGHRYILEALGLRPLLDLHLALGEGTGAVLAMPLLRAAARILHMATFEEAGVSDRQ